MEHKLKGRIFGIRNEKEFLALVFDIFHYQATHNPVYNEYLREINVDIYKIDSLEKIPFLPISFFKSHDVLLNGKKAETNFYSSGTTGIQTSRHKVAELKLYEASFMNTFRLFYGNPRQYYILALLPSYHNNPGSSLLYMVSKLIKETQSPDSSFFPDNMEEMILRFRKLKEKNDRKIIIWGVSYALLDLAEKYEPRLQGALLIETGGMKGRRKELVKEELHQRLIEKLGIESVHSEYGMTELLSQAYSKGQGIFNTPPWMRIMIRDIYDPFCYTKENRTGGINIIDLANLYSCSFIETQDLGSNGKNGSFRVLGRFDSSDIRGCNLLLEH